MAREKDGKREWQRESEKGEKGGRMVRERESKTETEKERAYNYIEKEINKRELIEQERQKESDGEWEREL